MIKIDFRNQVLPHLVAVVVFLLITVLFYNPLFFENKNVNQNDVLQGLGAGQEIRDYREATGEEALWTNSMFGGMPAYLINTQWSGDLLSPLRRGLSLWLPSPASVTFFGMLSFYLMLLVFGVRPYLAIAGSIAFGLGSFNVLSIEAGHMWKVWAIAYMPLVLSGVYLTYQGKWLWGFALTSLGLGLEISANHLQIAYYLFLLLLIFGLVFFIFTVKEKKWHQFFKATGIVMIAGLLAVACNFGKLWTVYEYGQYSIRGPSELTSEEAGSSGLDREYAFRWSNGIFEPITLFIPHFYGGASIQSLGVDSNLGQALRARGLPSAQIKEETNQVRTYWGQQPSTGGPIYAGAIICFLFVLGILFAEKKLVYWLVAGVVVSIVLSWGKNFESFNYLMFDYFPGYNKFRAVSMAIIIALICLPLLGFLGLENLFKEGWTKTSQRKLLIAAVIPAGFGLLVFLFAGTGGFQGASDQARPDWYLAAIRADRESLMRSDAIRSVFFLLGFVAVLFMYFKNKVSTYVALPLLTLLVLVDTFAVSKRYLNEDDFERNPVRSTFQPTEADAAILKDPSSNYRVLTFLTSPWSDARTSYFHKSLGGYHGAKMRRYNDLIERCIAPEFNGIIQRLNEGNTDLSGFNTINMLNTRYLIAGNNQNAVLRNDHAMGNAWFVSNIKEVQSPDEEIAAICEATGKNTAVIDVSKFSYSKESIGAQGSIELEEYLPNYLKYNSSNSQQGLALFSEIYYPKGWEARIDGEPAPILRANYVLRALNLPAGEHTIEFTFKPASYFIGNRIMMVASILTLLLLILVVFINLKKILSPVPGNEQAA